MTNRSGLPAPTATNIPLMPGVSAVVAIGVATRALRNGEVVMRGDVVVQGYAQVQCEAPPFLVEQWKRAARRRAWRRAFYGPLRQIRIELIRALGGIVEPDGHE